MKKRTLKNKGVASGNKKLNKASKPQKNVEIVFATDKQIEDVVLSGRAKVDAIEKRLRDVIEGTRKLYARERAETNLAVNSEDIPLESLKNKYADFALK